MFRRIRQLQSAVADYTVGTVIVMMHMATAGRHDSPRRLPAPSAR